MKKIVYITTTDNKYLSINNERKPSEEKSINYRKLNQDKEFLHFKAGKGRDLTISIHFFSERIFYGLSSIFIKDIYMIVIGNMTSSIFTKHFRINITMEYKDLKNFIDSLPERFCKLGRYFINIDTVEKNSISYKENITLNDNLLKYDVSFRFYEKSIITDHNTNFIACSNKNQANYFLNYYAIQNKNKILAACK